MAGKESLLLSRVVFTLFVAGVIRDRASETSVRAVRQCLGQLTSVQSASCLMMWTRVSSIVMVVASAGKV